MGICDLGDSSGIDPQPVTFHSVHKNDLPLQFQAISGTVIVFDSLPVSYQFSDFECSSFSSKCLPYICYDSRHENEGKKKPEKNLNVGETEYRYLEVAMYKHKKMWKC